MSLHKTAIALALTTLFAGAAYAAEPMLPKDLPPYAPDKPLPVPQIEKKTLANGLEVWVVPRDGIPRVDYVLAVRNAGLAADAPNASGFASLFAGLLTEGTARRARLDIGAAGADVLHAHLMRHAGGNPYRALRRHHPVAVARGHVHDTGGAV